jgi:hypothetical protein
MSAMVKLIYNAIVGGKFYVAGEPVPQEILPPNLRQYIAKPTRPTKPPAERHLDFKPNQAYSVDADGFLRGSPDRQARQMAAEVDAEEELQDDLAEAEVSEPVAAAIEEARQDYYADVAKQKANARAKAQRQEQVEDHVREEQDAAVADGDFDEYDSPRPAARAVSGGSKSNLKAKRNSYVLRKNQFVPAAKVKLVEGKSSIGLERRNSVRRNGLSHLAGSRKERKHQNEVQIKSENAEQVSYSLWRDGCRFRLC